MEDTLTSSLLVLITVALFTTCHGLPLLSATGKVRQTLQDTAVFTRDKTLQPLNDMPVLVEDNTRQSLHKAGLVGNNTGQFLNDTAIPDGENIRQSRQDQDSVQDQLEEQDNNRTNFAPVKQRTTRPPTNDFCFQDKCRCSINMAICSHNHGKLTYISRLPPSVKFLVLFFNNLQTISFRT